MNVKKKFAPLLMLLVSLFLVGCNNGVSGELSEFELDNKVIKSGESTFLSVNVKNTGKDTINASITLIPEKNENLYITYSGSLVEKLNPGEEMGRKRIPIVGSSKISSSKVWIKATLKDEITGEILDNETIYISIQGTPGG